MCHCVYHAAHHKLHFLTETSYYSSVNDIIRAHGTWQLLEKKYLSIKSMELCQTKTATFFFSEAQKRTNRPELACQLADVL